MIATDYRSVKLKKVSAMGEDGEEMVHLNKDIEDGGHVLVAHRAAEAPMHGKVDLGHHASRVDLHVKVLGSVIPIACNSCAQVKRSNRRKNNPTLDPHQPNQSSAVPGAAGQGHFSMLQAKCGARNVMWVSLYRVQLLQLTRPTFPPYHCTVVL